MPLPANISKYLDSTGTKHDIVKHKKVFTVYDLAQTTREKLNTIVKSLLVKADKEYLIVALPAHYRLDITKLKKLLKVKKVTIAPEQVMKAKFKVKPGALSAFGTVHKIGVVADASLRKIQKGLFQAGSYTESVRMKIRDYLKIEQPTIGSFVTKKTTKK